jgi:two-component sensor histidine kinase
LLAEHGVRRAMNVILQGDGSPFGVLEVDSTSEGEFSEHDIAFLQGAANILGMAIEHQAPGAIQFAADRAILVGLIITELVSNAGKYAYPDRAGGPIWVQVQQQPAEKVILISVRDEGRGPPSDFDPATSKRLGTRLVNALSQQLGGDLTRPISTVGMISSLFIPL